MQNVTCESDGQGSGPSLRSKGPCRWCCNRKEENSEHKLINMRLFSLKYVLNLFMHKDHRLWKSVIKLTIKEKSNFPLPFKLSLSSPHPHFPAGSSLCFQ